MKKSVKAALLSGLIFPGIGQIALREYVRGSGLLVLSLSALSIVVASAYQQAVLIVDRIASGDVPIDAGTLAQTVSNSANAADNFVDSAASIVLVVCWLAGIFDAYRLGATQDRQNE